MLLEMFCLRLFVFTVIVVTVTYSPIIDANPVDMATRRKCNDMSAVLGHAFQTIDQQLYAFA